MGRNASYQFAKLHLVIQGENEDDFLREKLLGEGGLKYRGDDYNWGFVDVEELEVSNKNFLFGYLVKYKQKLEEEVVDEESRKTETTEVKKGIINKAPFFLLIGSEIRIVAYHRVQDISYNQFQKYFEKLIEVAREGMFVDVAIGTFSRPGKIFQAIEEFDKIDELLVTLTPTNPSFTDMEDQMTKALKEMNAELKEDFSAHIKEKGIKISENEYPWEHIKMAEDGFGEAEVRGIKNGREQREKTRSFPEESSAPSIKDANIQEILYSLLEKFKEILTRRDE